MQADHRVDSTKMITVADHRWDEQYQYEFDKYKDCLLRLEKNLELLGKEERLDDFHEHLEQMCKQQLQRLHQQEFHDSLQREWETGEGLNRLVMKQLEYMGNKPGYEKLPQEEIEHLFKAEIELQIKDGLEHHMCMRWADYFRQSLGMHVQTLPNDLPAFRRQIERLRRESLQNWQDGLLSIERAYLHSGGVDTNSVFCGLYEPDSVSAQLALRKFLHQQFLLSTPGGEGSDVPRSNHHHGPTLTSSTEANSIPLLYQFTEKQSQDKRSISVISIAGSGGSSSEGTSSTITGGINPHSETIASNNDTPMVILDNQSQGNLAGNFNLLSDLTIEPNKNVVFITANGEEMPTYMSGSVRSRNFELTNVHYCPDVGNKVFVSGSELDKDDFKYEISRGEIIVTDLKTGRIVGEGRLVDGNYILDYLKIPRDRTTGFVTTLWNSVCSALYRLGLKY